jgi:hypothetical protein
MVYDMGGMEWSVSSQLAKENLIEICHYLLKLLRCNLNYYELKLIRVRWHDIG